MIASSDSPGASQFANVRDGVAEERAPDKVDRLLLPGIRAYIYQYLRRNDDQLAHEILTEARDEMRSLPLSADWPVRILAVAASRVRAYAAHRTKAAAKAFPQNGCLSGLDEIQHSSLVQFYLENRSTSEIQTLIGIPEVQFRRLRSRIKNLIKNPTHRK